MFFKFTSKFPTKAITVTTLPHLRLEFEIIICCSSALKLSQIHNSFGKLHNGHMSSSLMLSYHNLRNFKIYFLLINTVLKNNRIKSYKNLFHFRK